MSDTVLVVGATSGIARAICRELARQGNDLVIAGRNTEELAKDAVDLRIRFQRQVQVEAFDAAQPASFPAFWKRCCGSAAAGLTGVIVSYGTLPDQSSAQQNAAELRDAYAMNLVSVAELLELAAAYFEPRKSGFIAAISSVAGDRGRQSNYIYGSAKAGVSAYLQGLRNRLFPAGVHVLTIKPGFVATRMTAGKVNPKSKLLVTPEHVAGDICRAIRRRKNVLYTPRIWRLIMAIIRSIPEFVFKRLKM